MMGGEMELGIRQLPQQEVAQPLFSACSDEQLRVWHIRHAEVISDGVFIYGLRWNSRTDDFSDGFGQLPTARCSSTRESR